jgi:hypothetical protein
MKLSQTTNPNLGLTFPEFLVVVALLCLLVALLFPTLAKSRNANRTACSNNLRQIVLAENVWPGDASPPDALPYSTPTNDGGLRELVIQGELARYYQTFSNELVSTRVLTCPADNRSPATNFVSLTTNHLSYFLNIDAPPGGQDVIALHGDRRISLSPASSERIITLTTNTSGRWASGIHSKADEVGNLAFPDCSVRSASNRDLTEALFSPAQKVPQRLLFP